MPTRAAAWEAARQREKAEKAKAKAKAKAKGKGKPKPKKRKSFFERFYYLSGCQVGNEGRSMERENGG